ncbi:7TM diverse intracellular signaling domain-containing protein [Lysobacter yananisis]|uniref:diguanylate cyclase n=1 Tax=Lysobacter yananisis TaxID=1003114 RepID=A0ABY9P6P3_9GAMM|nr:7TM diverse intracellular signaling domain-containing protein [Lysobacter yananisis]WMT02722.1 7TM diverse intracellular signaling domain-containing protein [Lysobacter yananisis]
MNTPPARSVRRPPSFQTPLRRPSPWRPLPWLLLLALLLAGWSPLAAAQRPLELGRQDGETALAPFTAYHHDPDGRLDLAGAERALAAGGFRPLPGGNSSFGFQRGAYWFHIAARNADADTPRWLLVQGFALSDRLDVYTVAHGTDGARVRHQAGGDSLPFAARAIRYRHPNFWIDLPAGQRVDLFVRVQSQSSMQVPLTLYSPSAFTGLARDAQLGIGLYYGILLALFFYNLVLWLSLRDSSYFWYLFHICAFGLVLLTLNGLGFEYLWPRSPWLADHSVPLSICLAQVGMQQFARTFLGLAQRWRFGDRVGLGMIGFFVLLGLIATQAPYRIVTPIASAAVFVSIAWIAVATVVVLRRGYKPARLFLLAWSAFLLGTGMFAAIAFDLLPKVFITEYGVQIGSALEMLLLSVALGYRYASLRNENERIVREAKEQLEHKVEQRTGELRTALAQLEKAHDRLRETAQRDGLTGLHNRSHFREAFESLLHRARRQRRPLALMMIDLDHFKQINDHHGHLVGDECLRWAAGLISQTLAPHHALLARFGGEEFVAVLPDHDLDAGSRVAEALRLRLRAQPCPSRSHDIPVTASIGVHEIAPDSDLGVEAALQFADQALYLAKAGGRDCVRLWGAAA